MMPRPELYLPARAKLNLVLRVVGRRDDGYHLLETLFHTIDLHDDLWLARLPAGASGKGEIALTMTADEPRYHVPVGSDNLIVRAIERVRDAAGDRSGFAARLHKRIPVGGGLGGGSSDAAAALRLANALLGEPLGEDRLHAIAASLGADVPFLLHGGSRWGRGTGTELSPAEVAPRHFVLVVPPFDCPTAAVYKNHAPNWNNGGPQVTSEPAPIAATREGAFRTGFHNDLRAAAEIVRPALADLRARVAALCGLPVHLTGSGSTLFVAGDDVTVRRCARDLAPLLHEGVRILSAQSWTAVDVPRSAN